MVQCTNNTDHLPPPSPLPENEDELTVNGVNGGSGEEAESTTGHQMADDNSASSDEDEGDFYVGDGMALSDFIEHVRLKGRKGKCNIHI